MNLETKKLKVKSVVKTLLILAILIISYIISVVTSSFYETNKKLIVLVICFILGLVLFLIIYGVLYLIAVIKISRKAKKMANFGISCDDRASKYFEEKSYKFHYDSKTSFIENLQTVKSDALSVIKDVAKIYGNGGDKYFYLGYTVYDATAILYGALDLIDSKITPIFKLLRAEDKPLNIVENLLEKAIENDKPLEEESPLEEKQGFLKKIGLSIVKATTFIFKGKIETAVSDVVKFVGFKAFETFEKNGKIEGGEEDK